jgi:hypothetical protein
MKTIIAGSRSVTYPQITFRAIQEAPFQVTEVISGGAQGPDRHGEMWASKHNLPLYLFLADWEKYGNSAGYIRNKEMAEVAEALIAVWDGQSKGTRHMIECARAKNLNVFVYNLEEVNKKLI